MKDRIKKLSLTMFAVFAAVGLAFVPAGGHAALAAESYEEKEDGYYDKHKTLELATPHGNYHLVVFSAFITKATDENTYKMTYGEAEKQAYIDRAWERSELPITKDSVDVTKNDRLVTLSTCAYDYEEARYIVMCKMVPWTKAEVQAGKDAQKK